MSPDFHPREHPALDTHHARETSDELLTELGLSGRAIRAILPHPAPAGVRFETDEFE